jgi:ribulose bisphosphate carboxylase small subunit
MLERIKLLLSRADDDSADELLNTLISMCKEEAYIYCNLPEYDNKLDFIVVSMVIEKYNRMGSEGTLSQSSSGVSASYDSFYSDKIVRMLNKFRKVKMV